MWHWLSILCTILFLSACTSQTHQQKPSNYYDFNSFFKEEVKRLNGLKPTLQKTVRLNEREEQKKLNKSINWENELAFFLEIDLLKPAYQGAYQEQKQGNHIRYKAKNNALNIQEIDAIFTANGTLKSVCIYKKSQNYLFTSNDTLYYATDSLYRIQKTQKAIILGNTSYHIEGKF